jgi:hypothetical protein
LPWSCDWSLLLHIRCGGVSRVYYIPPLFQFMTTHVLQREYRRIWFWRHCPLMFTIFVCLFLGGIVSEFVQSLLPVRSPPSSLFFNSDPCSLHSTRPSNSVTSSCASRFILPSASLMLSEKANLLGSGIGLYVAYHLERYYRQRREVCPPFPPPGKR